MCLPRAMNIPILFVAFQGGARADGGLESLTHIIRNLRCDRIVVTQRESDFTRRWREAGCRVELVPMPDPRPSSGVTLAFDRLRRGPSSLSANRRVHWLVRELGVGVVHCNDPTAFWFGGIGAVVAGVPILLNLRDTRPHGQYGRRWRAMRHLATKVAVLSNEMRAEIDAGVRPFHEWLPLAEVVSVYSAVDLAKMTPVSPEQQRVLRSQLGVANTQRAIVYVGSFNPKKNQLEFIRKAAPRLAARSNSHLYFVGDFEPDKNEYASACAAAVRTAGLEAQVTFVGFQADPALWYRAADVVCLASRNEGLARAMIEALACGTPVVSFDVSSAREILEQYRCGFVAQQGDYPSLVEAIERLLDDTLLAADYGRRGAEAARRLFDPGRSVGAYAALYQRLANGAAEQIRSSSSE